MDELLLIIHNKKENYYFNPTILDGATVTWMISGAPGKLEFSYVADEKSRCNEGDVVQLKIGATSFFYGFIFTLKPNKDGTVRATAYDQLRYLKNKDNLVYKNKTATELIKLLADRFGVVTGDLIDTKYKIDKRIESNATLLDMIQFALDATLVHTKELYLIYDDFGKLVLNTPKNMEVPLLIDETTAQNFEYSRSIDKGAYNLIKLVVEDKEKGLHKEYYAPSDANAYAQSPNKLQWGVLQKFEKLNKNVQAPQQRANQMLEMYNNVRRKLRLNGVFGDLRVRSGSIVYVGLKIDDLELNAQKMIVTKVIHTFTNNLHLMSLDLKGGVVNA